MPEKNKNCLEGMRCPECGNYGPFRIVVSLEVMMYDNGADDGPNGDTEWDNDSRCTCHACERNGEVREFQIRNQKSRKKR